MPVVHELFGHQLGKSGERKGQNRRASCPHMDGECCDGGGNRNMARWRANDQLLAPLFDIEVGRAGNGYIPCGVCSIFSDRVWAICPRRLLTIGRKTSPQQRPLLERVLALGGFSTGERVQVWSEVTLRDDAANINYRLDYLLRAGDTPPIFVEIMTASTTGGNKSQGTDMRSAFCDAVLYVEGTLDSLKSCPNANIRQVWARMASQLIVKSQIANHWGGRAIWIVQNTLMNYIGSNTGLRLHDLYSPEGKAGEINVLSANLDKPNDIRLYSGPVLSSNGEACWSDLLSTPAFPAFGKFQSKLRLRHPAVEFVVP